MHDLHRSFFGLCGHVLRVLLDLGRNLADRLPVHHRPHLCGYCRYFGIVDIVDIKDYVDIDDEAHLDGVAPVPLEACEGCPLYAAPQRRHLHVPVTARNLTNHR